MNDTACLVLAGGAGVLLGAFFFGGLWWTVRMGVSSARPALWFLGSFLLRTGVLVAALYLVSNGHWDRLLACLLGLVIARSIVMRFVGPTVERHTSAAKEAGHAS